MKFLLVLAALVVSAVAIDEAFLEECRSKVKKIVEDCVAEEKASESDYQQIMSMKVPESHEGKCVYFCAHKRLNMQNDDGSINKEGAMATFEIIKDMDSEFHDKVIEVYHRCLPTAVDSDPCMYSVSLYNCFMKEAQAEGVHELIIK
ncbi:hypothetical protein MTP99_011507 [Tenebrio molitor]|nr:hypothetical protein MTP99_011507 [Tenebrio molitor]